MPTLYIRRRTQKLTTWLSMLLVLCLLGQALIPTFAYVRSAEDSRLWDQICSVYSNRTAEKSAPPVSGAGHHVDCPLCLHVFNDIILSNPVVTAPLHWLLVKQLRFSSLYHFHITQPKVAFQARDPPLFNYM